MDLSIVIPSKDEPYLEKTVESLKERMTGNTEILWAEDFGIGQRALTRELVEKAQGKYILKTDAHCLYSSGFDEALLEDTDNNTILAPYMLPLDAETWSVKPHPKTSQYCFDTNLVMQYDSERENLEPLTETMCLQGSSFMVSKENYFNWNLDETSLGSWGHQGVELGIKAYLNGGVCKVTKRCHYGHLFRLEEKDFPYQRDMTAIKKTSDTFKDKFLSKDIKGLIEKYDYPADWTSEKVDKLLK
jgi:hypothetical protein